MAHLTDKSALVVEIERKKAYAQTLSDTAINSSMQQFYDGMKEGCNSILNFLDTIEVKEVDLDFMIHEYWKLSPKITIDCLESATMTKDEMINFAKHFFELGLKAQKGE